MSNVASANTDHKIPDHIPPHLVADYDIWVEPTTPPDIQMAVVNKLHHQLPDIFYTPLNGGHWMVSRMDHLRKVVTDGATFSSSGASTLPNPEELPLPPQDMDAPDHMKYRKVLLQFLAPKDLSKQAPHVLSLCNKLIDDLEGRNSCNFKEEIAVPLPVSIFMAIMDWDTSRIREFVSWSVDIISSNDPAVSYAGMLKLQEFLSGEIAYRQENPGDDPLSLLLASKVDGVQLTPQRVREMANLLFTAGTDTVTNAMTYFMFHLARHPEMQDHLRGHPEEIDVAVEEMLRRYSFVNVVRRVTRDVEFEGVQMRAGDRVIASLAAASNDDRWVKNPEQVDLSRGRCPHVAFNTGPHACIGAPLARLELKIFLAEWLRRMPNVKLADGFWPKQRGGAIMSLESLEITW
ncbi:cytochrome P450 [Rhizorhapis sp. SPR117]|uniref:cytochrome P450 n=1 Tax=Rhizorhapis sp. SPR117 TaxID=2912611 RepID=UPI001F42CBBE|nr:cytochrome P450 [Rhizorhapis sp. SPR117]